MTSDLTKYNFSTLYSSPVEISNFYKYALCDAKLYKRITAYFSNNVFSHLKKGLPEFINHDGYFQLVLSKDIDAEVINNIEKGYSLKEKQKYALLSKSEIMNELDSICVANDISIFAFLIAIGKLDVKIAFKKKGIIHDKFGLISDGVHNLAYIGSNNFTENAIINNDEAFQVTIDWDGPSKRELSFISQLHTLFDNYWDNQKEDVITVELPDPVIMKMIKNIDYEDVKKYISQTDYIKLDIDDNNVMSIATNLDPKELFVYNNFKIYNRFIKLENDKYILKNISKVTELYEFSEFVKKMCQKLNVGFYLSYRLNNFFDLRVHDYDELRIKGNAIKDIEYLFTEEFAFYKKSINDTVKRNLVDQQIVAASHIINMERSLNFSVPGSGKTATVLGAFEYLNSLPNHDKRHVDKLLIIGPVNCSKSWRDEYDFVSYKSSEHKPLNIIGSGTTFEKAQILKHDYPTSRLILINYESVISLKDELKELVNDKTFIVFDEIHRIKSITSEKYEVLMDVAKNTRYRVALTGTPLPNGYVDLYNIISLLHDDYTSDYFGMNISSLKTDDRTFKQIGIQNEELNQLLKPFYIRVSKKDLNVPPAQPDHHIFVNVSKQEKELYEKITKNYKNSFERMIKFQEVGIIPFRCDEINNNENEETINVDNINIDDFYTSKINTFLKVLSQSDSKCVVWCLFVDSIKLITKILQLKGYKAKAIYGSVSQDERDRIIDKFNYSNEVEIIVTNPATLAESVSLHKACHSAHYLEYNYNLYQYLQSRDRIHRLGLKENEITNYYLYVNQYTDNVEDSADYKILSSLKTKEKRMLNSIEKGDFLFEDGNINLNNI